MSYNSGDLIQTAQTVLTFIREQCLQQEGVFSDSKEIITILDALENDIKTKNRTLITQRLQTIKTMIVQTGSNVLGSIISTMIGNGGI